MVEIRLNDTARNQQVQWVVVKERDGALCPAVHDLTTHPPVKDGDKVLLNTTANSLHLSTGGVHFIHAVLNHPYDADQQFEQKGHIMKLRYTSLQRSVLAVEEQDSPFHETLSGRKTLHRMPVLIGELHSMLPIATAWIKELAKESTQHDGDPRMVYIMTDSGALPLGFSHHVNRLRSMNWLDGVITYGHAYGGDLEAVNKFTALLAARHVLQANIAIITPGPGIVGTGTVYGHSGMETGELINAVHALDGIPIAIPRISFADHRQRHRGISHHTLTALKDAALARALVPLPLLNDRDQSDTLIAQVRDSGLDERHQLSWTDAPSLQCMEQVFAAYGEPITSMERELRDDPAFFASVCATAAQSYRLLRSLPR